MQRALAAPRTPGAPPRPAARRSLSAPRCRRSRSAPTGCRPRRGRSPRPRPARTRGRRVQPLAREPADVEVVDDVVDQVREVLDERHVGLEVAGDAQAAEHLLAEAVGGGDGGRVEAGDGARQVRRRCNSASPRPAASPPGPRPRRRRPGQPPGQAALDADQPLAHPLAQLAGGDPGEGDQQQSLERRSPRRRSARSGRRSCTSCPSRRSPRARSPRAAAARTDRTRRAEAAIAPALTGRAPPRAPAGRPTAGGPGARSASPRPRAQPSPASSVTGRDVQHLVESVSTPPSTSWCSGSRSSWSKFHSVSHALTRGRDGRPAPGAPPRRRRPTSGRTSAAARACRGRRGRSATASSAARRLAGALVRVIAERLDPGRPHVAAALAAPDRRRRERPLRGAGGEREQPHPGGEPVLGRHAREGGGQQQVAAARR